MGSIPNTDEKGRKIRQIWHFKETTRPNLPHKNVKKISMYLECGYMHIIFHMQREFRTMESDFLPKSNQIKATARSSEGNP